MFERVDELVEFVNQLIITDFDRADLNELGTFAHTQSGCFRIDHDVIRESSGQRVHVGNRHFYALPFISPLLFHLRCIA